MIDKNRLKKIKIIVSDLDGSLLNNEGKLGPETKRVINELRILGVQFSLASGRLHSALIHLAEELDLQIPLISLDGSMIKSNPGGEIIFESFVKQKYVVKALDFADRFLLNVALCHADAIYYTENNSVIPRIMDKLGARYEEVPSYNNYLKETLEVVIASDYKENLRYVKDKLSFPHTFGLGLNFYKSQHHKGIYYLELRTQGASKGKSFLKLLTNLRIKPEESVVIGDWYNDISLFETSAFKVAPDNSIPELKNKADFVTQKNNDEEGIVEFLELVLKAKRG